MASTMTSPPSPMLSRFHLGLTGLLLVGVAAFAGLAIAGRVHFGRPAPAAPSPGQADRDSEKTRADDRSAGRYQIEPLDDVRQVLGEAGKLGVLGERVREAWAFRYRGGFAECKVETDFEGKPVSSGQIPDNWARFLTTDEGVKKGNFDALRKEGFIVLLGMAPVVSVAQALEPLHPHLGAMFTAGPAGPLHSLIPYYHEVWRRREYRLFLSAGPLKDKTGPGFNLWAGDLILVRSHLINDDLYTDPAHIGGGKDLEAGKEMTLLERNRGLTKIRLKARFLTDAEAVSKARGE